MSVWVFSFFIFVTIPPVVVHYCVGQWAINQCGGHNYLALGCGIASCEEIGFDSDDTIDDYTVFYSLYMYNLNPLIQLNHLLKPTTSIQLSLINYNTLTLNEYCSVRSYIQQQFHIYMYIYMCVCIYI